MRRLVVCCVCSPFTMKKVGSGDESRPRRNRVAAGDPDQARYPEGGVFPHQEASRRVVRKKAKDAPCRPLSAYNFFFKEERKRIVAEARVGESTSGAATARPRPSSEVFGAIGKTVAARWRQVSQEDLLRYQRMAEEDMERYRNEMNEYYVVLAKRRRVEGKDEDYERGQALNLKQPPPTGPSASSEIDERKRPPVQPSGAMQSLGPWAMAEATPLSAASQRGIDGGRAHALSTSNTSLAMLQPQLSSDSILAAHIQQKQLQGTGIYSHRASNSLLPVPVHQGAPHLQHSADSILALLLQHNQQQLAQLAAPAPLALNVITSTGGVLDLWVAAQRNAQQLQLQQLLASQHSLSALSTGSLANDLGRALQCLREGEGRQARSGVEDLLRQIYPHGPSGH